MADPDEDVRAFFRHYGATLTIGRPETIAACYVAPALIVGDERARVIEDVAEVAAAFDGSAERYAAEGLVEAEPDVIHIEWLSEVLVNADVHWSYNDARGRPGGEDGYRYLLRRTGDGLRIVVVVATPERLRWGDPDESGA